MTTLFDSLEPVKKEMAKCMKCGNCMAVCPVYLTEKTEAGVARGKISLAQAIVSGELDLQDKKTVEKLFDCLICKSCMQNCPCGVQMDKIVFSLRAAIARKSGLHPLKKIIFGTLERQRIFNMGMRLGGLFQPLIFRKDKDGDGYYPRLPMGLSYKRILPQFNITPFRGQVPEVITPIGAKTKTRVAFFTGCSINYIYPQVGKDVLEVLKNNGVEVVIPQDQNCCGIAVLAHGDVEGARKLARSNIDAMEKTNADYIITACGSCGGSWQHEMKEYLANDPVYAAKAEYWSKRAVDISTFLTKVINYRKPKGEVKVKVTYHDSCHLKKSLQVYQEPRQIIKSIPGVTFNEMQKPDACCGGGGSYSLTHYETSMEITKRKINDINETNADQVLTGCPGCMMQIFDGINQFGKEQTTNHYISLLAASYRREKQNK